MGTCWEIIKGDKFWVLVGKTKFLQIFRFYLAVNRFFSLSLRYDFILIHIVGCALIV